MSRTLLLPPLGALLLTAALGSTRAFAQEGAPPPASPSESAAPPRAEDPTPLPPPAPAVSRKYVLVASLGAAAAVTFFVSALFDSLAGDAYNDATSLAHNGACGTGPSCSAFDAKHHDASRDRVVSGVFAGVGTLALVGGLATWIWWPENDASAEKRDGRDRPRADVMSASWLAPAVGAHGASLEVGARF